MGDRCHYIEVYLDGSVGCPELNLMGYNDANELFEDIKKESEYTLDENMTVKEHVLEGNNKQ